MAPVCAAVKHDRGRIAAVGKNPTADAGGNQQLFLVIGGKADMTKQDVKDVVTLLGGFTLVFMVFAGLAIIF